MLPCDASVAMVTKAELAEIVDAERKIPLWCPFSMVPFLAFCSCVNIA